MSIVAPLETGLSTAELAARVGDVPLRRIRMDDPPPGAATEADVARLRDQEDRLYELIDGVLVEKAMSDISSILAAELIILLGNYVKPRRLGWILAPDGYYRLFGTRVRAPDVSFARRNQRPDGRPLKRGYAKVAPALAVEIFSPGNTENEIACKRSEFFAAGTELFWVVYPDREEIHVWTGPDHHTALRRGDTLDGGSVLPGFTVRVDQIFDAVNLDLDGVDVP